MQHNRPIEPLLSLNYKKPKIRQAAPKNRPEPDEELCESFCGFRRLSESHPTLLKSIQ